MVVQMDVQNAVNEIISGIPAHWKLSRVTQKAVKEIATMGLTTFVPAWMLASGAKSDAYINAILAAAIDAGGKKITEAGWLLGGDASPSFRVSAPSALYLALNSAPEPTPETPPAEIADQYYGNQPVIVSSDARIADLRAHMTGWSPYEAGAPSWMVAQDVAARQRGSRLFNEGWRVYTRTVADGAPPAKPEWATTHEAMRRVQMGGGLVIDHSALCAPDMTADPDWQLWAKPVEYPEQSALQKALS